MGFYSKEKYSDGIATSISPYYKLCGSHTSPTALIKEARSPAIRKKAVPLATAASIARTSALGRIAVRRLSGEGGGHVRRVLGGLLPRLCNETKKPVNGKVVHISAPDGLDQHLF